MQTERPRANPGRGVALIATAVVIGLFVLRNGFGTTAASDADDDSTSPPETAAATTPAGGGDTTATTVAAARPPSEVTVLVANASGVTGAAASQSERLTDGGYQTLEPDDAPEREDVTRVLFAAGFEREAATLAESIGAPANAIGAMPNPPPVELQGAQILVLLGPDLAERL